MVPDAPPVVFTPPSAGSPPAAPGAVFTPPSAGSPPGDPVEVFDPASAAGARVLESVTISGVTGVGAGDINGTHYVTGTYGGKKAFGNVESAPVIGWDGTRWEIQPLGGGAAYIAGGGDVPPDGTWTNVLITGTVVSSYTAPVPGYAAPPAVFTP